MKGVMGGKSELKSKKGKGVGKWRAYGEGRANMRKVIWN